MAQISNFELFGYILLGALVLSILTVAVGMIDYKYHVWKTAKNTTEEEAKWKVESYERLLEANKGKFGEHIEELLDEKTYWEDVLETVRKRKK